MLLHARSVHVTFALATASLSTSCAPDEGADNVLTGGDDGSGTTDTGTGGSTGAPVELPATFRFECLDVQTLGDADGDQFQARLLSNTWNEDIDDYRLSIMVTLVERDDPGGSATLRLASGVGPSADGLCAEPSSQLGPVFGTYDPQTAAFGPSSGDCSAELGADADPAGGTYTLTLGTDEVAYVFAEENDTTVLNCTADPATADAVPIRAVDTSFSASADGASYYGLMSGCLLESEGLNLCSCLKDCEGDGPDDLQADGDCQGCPTGGVPLTELLTGINPSDRCSDLMGAPAYDVVMTFSGRVLPANPETCV
jgi:hypothetical protein